VVRLSARVRITPADLDAYIESQRESREDRSEGPPLHHICTTWVGRSGSSTVTKGHVQSPDDLCCCQIDQVSAVGRAALIMLMLRSLLRIQRAPLERAGRERQNRIPAEAPSSRFRSILRRSS
jgi:hypothetical protein